MAIKGLRFWAAVLIGLASELPVTAQLDSYVVEAKPPQARSREEFKAYLNLAQANVPEKTLNLADALLSTFPDSEFKAQVYRFKMHAYRSLGDVGKTLESGEKSLAANPLDVDTLLTLASVLPNQNAGTKDFDLVLQKAGDCANRALRELETLKASRSVSLSDWGAFQRRMRASAHEALGVVAFKREDYTESVKQLERCVRENPIEEGPQLFKLGVAYQFTGDRRKAVTALERAIELGPEVVATKARVQLRELHQADPE